MVMVRKGKIKRVNLFRVDWRNCGQLNTSNQQAQSYQDQSYQELTILIKICASNYAIAFTCFANLDF